MYNGSMTVKAKGNNALHTPFNHARKAPQTAVKLKSTATSSLHASRPLGDKTPFPNRQYAPAQQLRTPKPQAAKLLLEVQDEAPEMLAQTPECLLLPSATRRRKSLRLPSAISKSLKTPATKGNYWDVSDGDLELSIGEGDSLGESVAGGDPALNTGAEEDDDIEYMPPKVPEQPWVPPFDMPDYKTLGRALLRVAHGERVDDSADVYYTQDIESQIDVPQLLTDSGAFELSTLEMYDTDDDDPFAAAERDIAAAKQSAVSKRTRTPSVGSNPQPDSRSGGTLARPDSRSSLQSHSALTPTPPTTHRVTRSSSIISIEKHSITSTATAGTNARRVQPARAASSRSTAAHTSLKPMVRSTSAKPATTTKLVEPIPKAVTATASQSDLPIVADMEFLFTF
ncbi:uncharacterized protein PHACADRAFT_124267 [Phanerochaete carnosa HHB-10118-sp]|uniref:Uncharacterized protein n=1 Tax=Phanerochaete carnosa (strain HHB-10118-sp) TaxID=650164 RepID=K5VTQ4_PHACS|nr:uncharacterized protein PHACADRAFT_124267 [Phanerochaete carnosa HHB-10118-sp]EKM54868.1 hypothetical protein PHACADRAFT_124267 [Phanerochaete carnosa HHB-10118-sp]